MRIAGELIAEGKVAEVFALPDGRAIKLYRAGQRAAEPRREAAILDVVEALGIVAPRAFAVEQVGERWGLVMSRVAGRPFAEDMLADAAAAGPFFTAMARLQATIHAVPGAELAPLKVRLIRKLEASGLDARVIRRLRDRLSSLPGGDRLLHGDFHPFNVMGAVESPVAVDWLDATCGPPSADVCRSWLLMRRQDGAAQSYLAAYQSVVEMADAAVFAWLPVLAAARLSEGVPHEADELIAMAEAG